MMMPRKHFVANIILKITVVGSTKSLYTVYSDNQIL